MPKVFMNTFSVKISVFSICLVYWLAPVKAQEQIAQHSKLNISVYNEQDSLVKASILLWDKYLLNKEKETFNIVDYWSNAERQLFSDQWVDARYRYLDYSKKNNTFSYYHPLILSTKKEGKDRVLIKTLFHRFLVPQERLVVTKIIDVYAIIENNRLVLQSPLFANIKNSTHKSVGSINYYVTDARHKFNMAKAVSCDSANQHIAALFGVKPLKVHYVLCDSTDAMLRTIGYTFEHLSMYQDLQKGGLAEPLNKIIFSGNGEEVFIHELVHLYVHSKYLKNPLDLSFHNYADEGVATYFGGSINMKLEQILHLLYLEDKRNSKDFVNFLSFTDNFNGVLDYSYIIGGLFAKAIYELKGMEGLDKLLTSGFQDEDYYKAIETILGVKRENLNEFIHNELKKYAQ